MCPCTKKVSLLRLALSLVVTVTVLTLLWGPSLSSLAPSYFTHTPRVFSISQRGGGWRSMGDPGKPALSALSHGAVVHVATVMCGDREEEGLVMLKSLVALSASPLSIHIFALRRQHAHLKTTFDSWPEKIRSRVELKLYDVIRPRQWKRPDWLEPSYRPCSNHRIYLPVLLPHVDSVIYLDSDLLLLSPIEDLWKAFSTFNSTQLIGASPNTMSKVGGWYPDSAKHPYVPPNGISSGVLLLNLTRLRTSHMREDIIEHSQTYKDKLKYGDQDLLNIYFHYRPEELKVLSCAVNYDFNFCKNRKTDPTVVCRDAHQNGAYILHGIVQSFKQASLGFKPFYDGFKRYQLGEDLSPIVQKMKDQLNTRLVCTSDVDVFFKRLTAAVNKTIV